MTDVVALGEILIDFTFAGKSADGKNIYEENPGGAPANCACAVAKLGGKAAFVGMTGSDSFGEDLRETL
ncbi:MAG: carbohydrate kinase, partial [Treponema sp.]|nr:carbohydrate kinase [Treponema sp.]